MRLVRGPRLAPGNVGTFRQGPCDDDPMTTAKDELQSCKAELAAAEADLKAKASPLGLKIGVALSVWFDERFEEWLGNNANRFVNASEQQFAELKAFVNSREAVWSDEASDKALGSGKFSLVSIADGKDPRGRIAAMCGNLLHPVASDIQSLMRMQIPLPQFTLPNASIAAGGLSKVIADALQPELQDFEEAQQQVAALRQQLTSLEKQVAREDVMNRYRSTGS